MDHPGSHGALDHTGVRLWAMLEVMGKVWAILGLPGRHWFILGGRDLGLRAVLGGGGQCWDAGRDVKGGHWWLLGRGNLWHMHVAERLNEAVRRHLGGGGGGWCCWTCLPHCPPAP